MAKTYSTGLIVSPAEIQHNMSMFAASKKLLMAAAHPPSFDWRKKDGKDFTTPIRDQGKCGSGVSFATVALMESVMKIEKNDPALQPDLSEAYLFPRGGGRCEVGAQFVRMLMAAESGVCDEICCPYAGDWNPCPDYKDRLTPIRSYKTIFRSDQAKAHIATTGPIITGLAVYSDFFEYSGGVYTQSSGEFVGNHAVLLVGYNEAEDCWMGKNSWGTFWGNDGWFKIKLGECGMGSIFPFYSATVAVGSGEEASGGEPDLVAPIDGTLYVTMLKGPASEDAVLVVNGVEMGSLTKGDTVAAGEFQEGDAIRLDLKGIAHENRSFPSGWRIWTLRMGAGRFQFRVQVK